MPEARKELALTGLGLLLPGEVADRELGYVLAVPNKSPMVEKLRRLERRHAPGAA